jgi:hypothetical protein
LAQFWGTTGLSLFQCAKGSAVRSAWGEPSQAARIASCVPAGSCIAAKE